MDTEHLSQYIVQPQAISRTDLADLKAIMEKYPYCSTLHLLYIKGLANTNDIHFEEALKFSSIHVNDRERLYQIIHDDQTVVPAVTSGDEMHQSEDVHTKAAPLQEEIQTIEANTEATENQSSPEANLDTVEAIPDETIADLTASNHEADDLTIEDELEEGILNSAIEHALIFDVDNIAKPNASEISSSDGHEMTAPIALDFSEDETNRTDEFEITTDANVLISDEATDFDRDPEPITTKAETAVKAEDDITALKASMSFTEWLKYKQKQSLSSHQEPVEALAEDTELEQNTEAEIPEAVETKDPKLTKKEINHLLDKFLEEEPKISRPKKDFYNPVKNAKKSLDDSDILVSETLAKIYHLQKNYSKAIKAYEQLSLLNPKKKSFFAHQIRKIKKEELK